MPANLTPQFHEAEERFKSASSREDKILALEEMLRVIPKHKGTEKMQADLKSRLAKLRKQGPQQGGPSQSKPLHHVEREGVGQVVLCGPPNSGKSRLLKELTNAQPEIADYPFTTRVPQPGMMTYEDIQVQLVDTPPIAPETLEPWLLALIERGDVVLLLFDVNDPDLLSQTEFVLQTLQDRGIEIGPDATPPVLVLGNKVDRPKGKGNFSAWQDLFEGSFEASQMSADNPEDLARTKKILFETLGIVRVYTKRPGQHVNRDESPFVLKKGSTIFEVAEAVHKEIAERFRYARVWGTTRFDGQMVERTHVVEDGDVVEFHSA